MCINSIANYMMVGGICSEKMYSGINIRFGSHYDLKNNESMIITSDISMRELIYCLDLNDFLWLMMFNMK